MPAFRNLQGQQFERLSVIRLSHMADRSYWVCRCTCSVEKIIAGSRLVRGNDRSCGCLRSELSSKRAKRIMKGTKHHLTHGMTGTMFYTAYNNMKERCQNKNKDCYINYGGRGINVDGRWDAFESFYFDMHDSYLVHVKEYGARNTSLDRIDNDKGYSKENCRWATRLIQNNNKRKGGKSN
jgi:hypothetical protein